MPSIKQWIVYATIFCSLVSFSKVTSIGEVYSIMDTIDTHYAPLEYKDGYWKSDFEWSNFQKDQTQKLLDSKSTEDFYKRVTELFTYLKDAHVSVSLPSNFTKTLELEFSYNRGETFVSYAGEEALSKCPVKLGDTLLSLNGKTPDAWRRDIAKYSNNGNDETDRRYLTLLLTKYSQAKGIPLELYESKNADFKFQRGNLKFSCKLKWKESGVKFDSRIALSKKKVEKKNTLTPELLKLTSELKRVERFSGKFNKLVRTHISEETIKSNSGQLAIGERTSLGNPVPFFGLPGDFKLLTYQGQMKNIVASTGLVAGTFFRNGAKIGFLRIPSYVPQDLGLALYALRHVISKLENETQKLIIDQTNNPGGYVAYSDWIVSSLVSKLDIDGKHMQFKARPTVSFLRNYSEIVNSLEQDIYDPNVSSEEKKLFKKYVGPFKKEYKKVSKAYRNYAKLSEPVSLGYISYFLEDYYSLSFQKNIELEHPAYLALVKDAGGQNLAKKVRYTKPVYMMINELDFSGGDATPANLQDYSRVTLVGTNTSGAGGSVGSFSSSTINPFTFRLTQSLMYRPKGKRKYVENIGVKPDIKVELRKSDYLDRFTNYFERVLSTINL